ncbi:MAG: cyclodeaminase/cyclohydrolase family protein, partial [Selenomonadaceae bacterium]|nr:cyclodeaminase/cyclohydrolase family protein [Selenomonadaceae bacterium]
MNLTDFMQTLSSDSPAPGGGSAAALIGVMGAGLTALVACLTPGRTKYAECAEFAASEEAQG